MPKTYKTYTNPAFEDENGNKPSEGKPIIKDENELPKQYLQFTFTYDKPGVTGASLNLLTNKDKKPKSNLLTNKDKLLTNKDKKPKSAINL